MRLRIWILPKLVSFALIGCFQPVIAQQQNIPIHHTYEIEFERNLIESNELIQNTFQPILESRVKEKIQTLEFKSKNKSWLSRKLFYEHYIQFDSSDVQFFIDPVVNFELGIDNGSSSRDVSHYINTRGFQLRLNLGEKFSIQSSFRENQANLISYVHERTKIARDAFGQGRVKSFGDEGFDYNMASSVFSYSPKEFLNIQFGHGKHFVGQGHRSFLLSDLAFNYPFLRINSQWFNKRLTYQNLYALFQNIVRLPSDFESEGLFQRNQAAIHYLEYSVTDNLNVGLFESSIWVNKDTSSFEKAGINYWVPLIYLNQLFDKQTVASNVGITANYTGIQQLNLYSQFASSGLDSALNYQLGAKYYFKSFPLRLLLEYNSSNTMNNKYQHYESSLGHPVQSGFSEIILGLSFRKNRMWSTLQFNLIEQDKAKLSYLEVRQSYIVNPSSRLSLTLGLRYREVDLFDEETNYYFFGLTTNLQNLYFDY